MTFETRNLLACYTHISDLLSSDIIEIDKPLHGEKRIRQDMLKSIEATQNSLNSLARYIRDNPEPYGDDSLDSIWNNATKEFQYNYEDDEE